MSNTEWKKGYEEGFAAGWKAAKEGGLNYTNYPPVYYGGTIGATMADSLGIVSGNPYTINTTPGYGTITLTEAKTDYSPAAKKPDLKVIRNLTDHTRIV